jgi:aryl-alcohol dehydrogenase-like predicted oxidoreductase
MHTKLAIGTANFGLDYGISNQFGKLGDDKIAETFFVAQNNNIDLIDTAQAYGNAEKRIGQALKGRRNQFNIVTKLAPNFKDDICVLISKSLKKLMIENLYCVLYHNFNDFLENPESYQKLSELKEKGKISKVGFSVYYPSEIEYLIDQGIKFDILQLPYNIFDTRFEYLLPILKQNNVEVHIRSVFLQGLVFLDSESLPPNLGDMLVPLNKLRQIADSSQVSIASLCLNFVARNTHIDKIVLGVDSPRQLMNNINDIKGNYIDNSILESLKTLKVNDEELVLPFNWK